MRPHPRPSRPDGADRGADKVPAPAPAPASSRVSERGAVPWIALAAFAVFTLALVALAAIITVRVAQRADEENAAKREGDGAASSIEEPSEPGLGAVSDGGIGAGDGGAPEIEASDVAASELDVYGEVPDFEFTSHRGKPFGREEMFGEVNVVSFQFTRCPGICRVMSAQLRKVYTRFADRDDLRIVTVTVDPDYDTPEILAEYAASQGVEDERWVFLQGPGEAMVSLSEDGFLLPADNLPAGHSSRFALVDRGGRIRGWLDAMDDADMTRIHGALESLLEEPAPDPR